MTKRRYKRKVTNNKGSNKKVQPKTNSKTDLAIIGLILLAILLGVLIYGKAGIIGIKLNEILGGMLGIIKYVIPIGVFAISIKIAKNDDEIITSRLILTVIILIVLSVLMSIFQINSNKLVIQGRELSAIVKDAYSLGSEGAGGGALGAILAVPLAKLLSPIGRNNIMYWNSNNANSICIWNKCKRSNK